MTYRSILYLLKGLMNHKHKHLPGSSSEASCSLGFDEPLTSKSHSTSVYVASESELETSIAGRHYNYI